MVTDTKAVGGAVPRRTTLLVALGLVGLAAALALYAASPWEWSLIDDPGLKLASLHATAQHGTVVGTWKNILDQWSLDRNWGLFRPAYWVYVGLFYLLSPRPAHVVRLLLLLAVIALPAVRVAGELNGKRLRWSVVLWTVGLLLANRSAYNGLSWLSIQELPGMALVALGFYARSGQVRTWSLAGAAWFKAAFLWLVGLHALDELRRRRWATGSLAMLLFLGTLSLDVWFEQSGTYTRGMLSLSHVMPSLTAFGRQAAPAVLVAVLGVAVARPTRAELLSSEALVPLLGAVAYLGNIVLWKGTATYYYAPPVFLGSLAAIHCVTAASARRSAMAPRGKQAFAPAAALAALVGMAVATLGVVRTFERDQSVRLVRDWAIRLSAHRPTIAVNDVEAAVRLDQIVAMRTHGRWRGSFVYTPAGAVPRQVTDYAEMADAYWGPTPAGLCQVDSYPRVKLFRRCVN